MKKKQTRKDFLFTFSSSVGQKSLKFVGEPPRSIRQVPPAFRPVLHDSTVSFWVGKTQSSLALAMYLPSFEIDDSVSAGAFGRAMKRGFEIGKVSWCLILFCIFFLFLRFKIVFLLLLFFFKKKNHNNILIFSQHYGTDHLIIDLTSNGGGNICAGRALLNFTGLGMGEIYSAMPGSDLADALVNPKHRP